MSCLELKKITYDLIQTARHYWKRFCGILRVIGITGGEVKPCFVIERSDNGILMIRIYVDNCLCVGN